MIKDIHSVGLNVRDLGSSIEFYCGYEAYALVEQFELPDTAEARARYGVESPQGKGALLRGHAGFIELTEFSRSAPSVDDRLVSDSGIRHICIRAQDVDGLFDYFDKAGSNWHARPHDLGTGLEYAYIRDPEGNLLELEGLPMMPPNLMKPWFDHAAIVTPDIDRLAAFYELLTEQSVSRRGSFGPEAKFDTVAGIEDIVFHGAWILFGVSRIEMWQYENPLTKSKPARTANEIGWSHLCVEVDDLTAEQTRLESAGVEFLGEKQSCSMGQSIFLRDIDGNLIKLLQVSKHRPELSIDSLAARPVLQKVREVSESSRNPQSTEDNSQGELA